MGRRGKKGHVDAPPPADGRDVWIFAYGSLMWDPGFRFEEARPALLRGYHRSFCLYSHRYRGTPEKPGLVLGLDAGGACRGIAYRVHGRDAEKVMSYLWDREMLNRAYECKELTIDVAGRKELAQAFVVRRGHPQYAGKLPVDRAVELICQGEGARGHCYSYLENTVEHLDRLGIPDKQLHELLAAVNRRRGASVKSAGN